MAENDFIYAVARIRTKELSLLSAAFLEQLLALPDEAACLKLLNEQGWGSAGQDVKTMLSGERDRTWQLIGELTAGETTTQIGRASVGKECRSRWSPYH